MNDNEREMDLALAEAEQENRLLRARNERLERELAENARELGLDYEPAPVQPVAPLKEVDVLMMAEAHGIDPNTKGLYGFYIDCISNHPVARPAPVPLTPEQIIDIRRKTTAKTHGEWADTKAFARAIEAAHGITAAPKKGHL
jgi:hypothetical protein